jgi:ABC-type multidrug transport system permease subunit
MNTCVFVVHHHNYKFIEKKSYLTKKIIFMLPLITCVYFIFVFIIVFRRVLKDRKNIKLIFFFLMISTIMIALYKK